jgi:hypothetical protein
MYKEYGGCPLGGVINGTINWITNGVMFTRKNKRKHRITNPLHA